ncbi:hypothetical protein DFH09DRAFT_1201454 [Mycena vulgaris]|nr:hypothetical protein DFH09DRAFT_1201454 [Mycena vulgaris]
MQNYIPLSSCIMSSSERSLFVTLAAHGLGYIGFSVSIVTWLWLTLVPLPRPDLTEPILVDKKVRRRSAPAALQARKRDSLTPAVRPPSPGVSSPSISPVRTRRVYFIDSPTPSLSRPTNQFERTPNDSSDLLDIPLQCSPPAEISPSSSSSTLVHTYPVISHQTLETCRESAIESDSSNSSPRPSLSLSRPFQKASERARRSSGTSVPEIAPIITEPTPDTKHRRSSIGFVPPWSFRRASGPRNPASTSPATSSATPSSATSSASPTQSYFSRKTARRVSTPVPRTQPYAYPYYAQPPIEDEGYAAHLRSLPQFETEVCRSPITSDSEEKDPLFDRRGRNRKANDMAQAALGVGRRPPARPPQRSASESWAAGMDPRL